MSKKGTIVFNDSIQGLFAAGNDSYTGTAGADLVDGLGGDDTLYGQGIVEVDSRAHSSSRSETMLKISII